MRRRTHLLAALLLPALALTACGDDDEGAEAHAGDAPAPAADARAVEVVADDFSFDPGEITAEAGEDLAIALTSEDMVHDLTIEELGFHVEAGRGDTTEGGLRVDEPGEYTYYCSVPGHRSAGMEGTLTVE